MREWVGLDVMVVTVLISGLILCGLITEDPSIDKFCLHAPSAVGSLAAISAFLEAP
jgi:hypothetical protein